MEIDKTLVESYKAQVKELKDKFDKDIKELARAFVFVNNPYAAGDRVTNGNITIQIDKIKFFLGIDSVPYCIYYGVIVNKNGQLNKKGTRTYISQKDVLDDKIWGGKTPTSGVSYRICQSCFVRRPLEDFQNIGDICVGCDTSMRG